MHFVLHVHSIEVDNWGKKIYRIQLRNQDSSTVVFINVSQDEAMKHYNIGASYAVDIEEEKS
jgi:hypothetical protein